jgi:hypothetical protein
VSAELIYKTTSPKAIEWFAEMDKLAKEQGEKRRAYEQRMTEEFGKPDLPDYYSDDRKNRRVLWVRGQYAFALDSGNDETPPVDSGWRLDSKDRNWQPKLATKQGKARAAELAELNTFNIEARLPEVGIAQMVFAGNGYLYRPGMEFDEGERALYVMWGSGQCSKEALAVQAKVPEVEWVEVPRSVWYARVEKIEAERAAEEAEENLEEEG